MAQSPLTPLFCSIIHRLIGLLLWLLADASCARAMAEHWQINLTFHLSLLLLLLVIYLVRFFFFLLVASLSSFHLCIL